MLDSETLTFGQFRMSAHPNVSLGGPTSSEASDGIALDVAATSSSSGCVGSVCSEEARKAGLPVLQHVPGSVELLVVDDPANFVRRIQLPVDGRVLTPAEEEFVYRYAAGLLEVAG